MISLISSDGFGYFKSISDQSDSEKICIYLLSPE
jgi:hypothetical protein